MIISPQAALALKGAIATRGKNKGQFLASAPRSDTLAYAAWHGAMLSVNPFKAGIGALLCMSPEQHAIANEITKLFDAMPQHWKTGFDRDREALERLGVW